MVAAKPRDAVLQAEASGRSSSRIPELDGIRALAIWLVLAGHLFAWGGAPHFLPGWLQQALDHGWLGVDLFFVLSGYLITTILLGIRSHPAGEYFRTFYARRALRILPLYLLVVGVLWLAGGKPYLPFLTICLLFAANVNVLLRFPGPPGAGPLWSLAVEEQFYLVWPWLVRWFSRRTLAIVTVAILIVEPLIRLFPWGEMELTWARADGLAMGALLALWFDSSAATERGSSRLAAGFMGMSVVLACVELMLFNAHAGIRGPSLRVSEAVLAFGALVTFGIARSESTATAILRSSFGRLTANYSYALYLVHAPLYEAYNRLLHPARHALLAPASESGWLLRGVSVLLASYAVAAFTRRFVELPFLKIGRRSSHAS